MYIALYVNCVRGRFIPYGFFTAEVLAKHWIDKQEEPHLYNICSLIEIDEDTFEEVKLNG